MRLNEYLLEEEESNISCNGEHEKFFHVLPHILIWGNICFLLNMFTFLIDHKIAYASSYARGFGIQLYLKWKNILKILMH